jgi:hypothetical protein
MLLHKKGARQPDALNPDNWAIDARVLAHGESGLYIEAGL